MNLMDFVSSRMRDTLGAPGQRGEKVRLLDDADMNIGNQVTIVTAAPAVPPQIIPNPNPERILNLNAASRNGQIVTVFIGASGTPVVPTIGGIGGSPALPPSCFITGVAEFGNGARFSSLEFDIPIGPLVFVSGANRSPIAPESGGVLIALPGATLRIYARSDANLITPNRFGTLPLGVAPNENAPDRLRPPRALTGSADVLVTALAAYFNRPAVFAPTKTLWLGKVAAAAGVTFLDNGYSIPSFAKTIRILRDDLATIAITFTIVDINSNILDQISLAAGTRSDTFKLPGNAASFIIGDSRVGGATTDPMPLGTSIQAVFELQV